MLYLQAILHNLTSYFPYCS